MKTQLFISLFALLTASILVQFPATARQVPNEDIGFVQFPATARQVPNEDIEFDQATARQVPNEDIEFDQATARQVPNEFDQATARQVPNEDIEFDQATARQVPNEDIDFVQATARQVVPNKDIEFVRSNCQKIPLHGDLCFNLLSRYARRIHQDSANLAHFAMAVSLAATEKMVNYASDMGRLADRFGADPQIASAVRQCRSSFLDAKDSIHDSITEMRGLGSAGSSETFRFKLNTVQTYMSTALTDEEDCLDVFEDLTDGKIKRLIRDKTQALEDITSVALALVGNCAKQVTN